MTAAPNALQFDAAEHAYRLGGRRLPHVTQICGVVGELYRGIPQPVLERARDRGAAVHYATELFDRGELGAYPPEIQGYLDAWSRFRAETGFHPEHIEIRVCDPAHGYAGTVDRVGVFTRLPKLKPGPLDLLDLKATYTIMPQVAVQTALYANAYRKTFGLPPKQVIRRWAVQLREDGTYRLHECNELPDLAVGLAALSLFSWRQTHQP